MDPTASFDDKNAGCIPPLGADLPKNPTFIDEAIRDLLRLEWNIPKPHDYQVNAIFHIAVRKIEMMYIIRKCGEGKSLI